MGQTRAEHIAFVVHEDLRLVFQPAEGRAVDDAVAVALELAAPPRRRFRQLAPVAGRFRHGVGGEDSGHLTHRRAVGIDERGQAASGSAPGDNTARKASGS